jgi:hypothetical protein
MAKTAAFLLKLCNQSAQMYETMRQAHWLFEINHELITCYNGPHYYELLQIFCFKPVLKM